MVYVMSKHQYNYMRFTLKMTDAQILADVNARGLRGEFTTIKLG